MSHFEKSCWHHIFKNIWKKYQVKTQDKIEEQGDKHLELLSQGYLLIPNEAALSPGSSYGAQRTEEEAGVTMSEESGTILRLGWDPKGFNHRSEDESEVNSPLHKLWPNAQLSGLIKLWNWVKVIPDYRL